MFMETGIYPPEEAAVDQRNRQLLWIKFSTAAWQGLLVFLAFSLLALQTAIILSISVVAIIQTVEWYGILIQNQSWSIAQLKFRDTIALDNSIRRAGIPFCEHLENAGQTIWANDPTGSFIRRATLSIMSSMASILVSLALICFLGWIGINLRSEMTTAIGWLEVAVEDATTD
jgi:hypothetical protein